MLLQCFYGMISIWRDSSEIRNSTGAAFLSQTAHVWAAVEFVIEI